MKLKAQLVKREIAGDTILVPVGETTTKLQGLLTINETGAAIWDALPAAENEEAIVEQLYEMFDVERDVLRWPGRSSTTRRSSQSSASWTSSKTQ